MFRGSKTILTFERLRTGCAVQLSINKLILRFCKDILLLTLSSQSDKNLSGHLCFLVEIILHAQSFCINASEAAWLSMVIFTPALSSADPFRTMDLVGKALKNNPVSSALKMSSGFVSFTDARRSLYPVINITLAHFRPLTT